MSIMEGMMNFMTERMSKEDKESMMDSMMDKFFAGISPEEKQKMMSDMMPRMMEGMNMADMMPKMMRAVDRLFRVLRRLCFSPRRAKAGAPEQQLEHAELERFVPAEPRYEEGKHLHGFGAVVHRHTASWSLAREFCRDDSS